ncbi:hypothetical protein ACKKBG_A03825 [Auxenochlorella protothecoides x Auxenochlorella symbiontica]
MATTASLPALLQRRRRELLLAAGVAVIGYAGYRAYHSDTVAAWRRALGRLGSLLDSASDTVASGSDLTGCLVRDVRDYLGSEDDAALPPRLRQLAALLQSPEVGAATSHTVAAIWAGVQDGSSSGKESMGPDLLDRILAAVMSEKGQSLVSLAVALGARNLAAGACEARRAAPGASPADPCAAPADPDALDRVLSWLGSAGGQRAARRMLGTLAAAGVGVYCDRTLDINVFDQLLAALASRAEHMGVARACISTMARETVRAAVFPPLHSRAGRSSGSASPGSAAGRSSDAGASPAASASGDAAGETLRRLASLSAFDDGGAAATKAGDAGSPRSVRTPPAFAEARPRLGPAHGDRAGHGSGMCDEESADVRQIAAPDSAAAAMGQPDGEPAWAKTATRSLLSVARDPDGRALVAAAAGAAAREGVAAAAEALQQPAVAAVLAAAFVALLAMQLLARLVATLLF